VSTNGLRNLRGRGESQAIKELVLSQSGRVRLLNHSRSIIKEGPWTQKKTSRWEKKGDEKRPEIMGSLEERQRKVTKFQTGSWSSSPNRRRRQGASSGHPLNQRGGGEVGDYV